TLLDLLEGCLVWPTWHNATSAVCRIDQHPATAVKHGMGTGQVNLVAFDGTHTRLQAQDVGQSRTVTRFIPMICGDEQRVIVFEALEEASKLVIDFLMH